MINAQSHFIFFLVYKAHHLIFGTSLGYPFLSPEDQDRKGNRNFACLFCWTCYES